MFATPLPLTPLVLYFLKCTVLENFHFFHLYEQCELKISFRAHPVKETSLALTFKDDTFFDALLFKSSVASAFLFEKWLDYFDVCQVSSATFERRREKNKHTLRDAARCGFVFPICVPSLFLPRSVLLQVIRHGSPNSPVMDAERF